jgi:hypothetical protein
MGSVDSWAEVLEMARLSGEDVVLNRCRPSKSCGVPDEFDAKS